MNINLYQHYLKINILFNKMKVKRGGDSGQPTPPPEASVAPPEAAAAPAEAAKAAEEAKAAAAAEALIKANQFMEKFFASFDENNEVVKEFPTFTDLGKLSENIITRNRQSEIINSLSVLNDYQKFLKDILV